MIQSGIQQALLALRANRPREAADHALGVLAEQPSSIQALAIAGAAFGMSGQYQSAREWLQRLCALRPNDADALTNLGQACQHLQRHDEAGDCYRRALELQPGHWRARHQLARLLQDTGDHRGARRQLETLLQSRPGHADALAMLAGLEAAEGNNDLAREHNLRALSVAPGHTAAHLNLARLELAGGELDKALERLQKLMRETGLSPHNKALALQLSAHIRHHREDYPGAFELYRRANEQLLEQYREHYRQPQTVYAPAVIERLQRDLDRLPPPTAPAPQDPPPRRPVFLLGFPRSGTTLLEQMLRAHPAIDSIEETDNLADLFPLLLDADQPLRAVAGLGDTERNNYRRAYWRRVDALAGDSTGAGLILDKLPLNSIMLPVIHLLFPHAKVIFAVRDPRDVVFSCYQQMFGMNEAMFQFLRLDSAVDYYHRVMRLATGALEKMPIDYILVRYEDLVADWQGAVTGVLRFLGCDWHDAIWQYRELAGGRTIDTPSERQVRRPISAEAIGKWRHYREFLPESFSGLDRWASHFVYTED